MSLAAFLVWAKANEALLATIAFAISEALGAIPKLKSNGIVSFIIIQAQSALKKKGATDLTP
jgi:hypothetical protein